MQASNEAVAGATPSLRHPACIEADSTLPCSPDACRARAGHADEPRRCAAGVQGAAEGRQPRGGEGAARPQLHLPRRVWQGGRPAEDPAQQQHRAVPGAHMLQQVQHPARCKRAGSPPARCIQSVFCETLSSVAASHNSCTAVQGACVEQDKMLLVTEFMDGVCARPLYGTPALVVLRTVFRCRPVMSAFSSCGMYAAAAAVPLWCMVQVATCARPSHESRSPGSCGARL